MTFQDESIAELSRLQEDMLYTEKAHFAAASRAHLAHFGLGGTATVASAGAATSIVSDGAAALSAVLALVATLAAALVTLLKPEELAQQHLGAGRDLGAIRVEARQIMNLDIAGAENSPDVRPVIRGIAERKAAVDRAAPAISERAFQQARNKITAGHFEHES